MTQDERWLAKYNEVVDSIETKHCNPSRHRIEEHDMLNWLKSTRERRLKKTFALLQQNEGNV